MIALTVSALLAGAVLPAPSHLPMDYESYTEGDEIVVTAVTAAGVIAESQAADPAVVEDIFTRDDLCGLGAGTWNDLCTGYDPATPLPDCEGQEPVPPVWRLHRDGPDSPWQQPTLALGWTCPQDALPVFTITDFRRLPIAPSVLTIQPPRAEVAVNMPTIVYADPTVQAFTTELGA